MTNKKKNTPLDKYSSLKEQFNLLKKLRQTHIEIADEMVSLGLWKTDIVIIAILRRSINLVAGFDSLIEHWNFTAAVPLIRLQLDNLLRLEYLRTLKNSEAFSNKIIKGISFRKLKDSQGKNLTDARLRDYARETYPQIDKFYEEASKFIHLSEKHILLSICAHDREAHTITFSIEEGDFNWGEIEINSFLTSMINITQSLLKVVEGWVIRKKQIFADQTNQ